MNKKLLAMMNPAEQALVREVYDGDLTALDEDELLDLHTRVRRARNKYSKLYRRRSAAKVKADKGRAKASAANSRTARKAEVFEDALAKVSRRLARVAREESEALKQERLAAARAVKGSGPAKGAPKGKGTKGAKGAAAQRKRRTGASKRSSAQARAATRRGEAKRAAKKR